MTGLQTGRPGRDLGFNGIKHVICERIQYTVGATVTSLKAKLPANAHVVGGGVHIVTAFNDSGTDTLDVGFKNGSATDDDNAYATLLLVSAVGYIVLDELATTTNIMQTKEAEITYRYNGQNLDASAGDAYLIIEYVVAP